MANIPSDAINYNGHSYKVFDIGKTWKEAKTYCESQGGHLVTITDAAEQSFIEDLLNSGSKNSYWIGCKLNSANQMSWMTGENMTYSNWASDEPDNYQRNQGYGLILRNAEALLNDWSFGEWSDINYSGNSWEGDSFYYTFWGTRGCW